MKIRTWTVGLAVLALGGTRAAAETSTSGWSYDNNVNGVAFASDCCEPECGLADPCCSDPCCGDACDCGSACGRGGLLGAVEGFSLAGLLGLSNDYEVGGWTNVAYYDNNIPLSQTRNDLLSFQDVPDNANVAQQWFYLGRKVDGSAGLDIGGRIDVVYGVDAQKTQAFGNPRSAGSLGQRNTGTWDGSLDHGIYGWAIPQAYAEIASGDLSVKVGHFFTPLGYEVIPATGNFFMSHSYTMFNSEPFTHTGALATYTGMENLTLYGGWSAGWDTGFDSLNAGSTAIGGFTVQASENIAFTYISTYGNFGLIDAGGDNSYSHSMVMTVALTDRLQYIAQSDNLRTDNTDTDSYGLNQYLIYRFNDVISTGGRVEWWKLDGLSYYEATGGFNIHVLDNLVFRPEARQDWAPGIGLDQETYGIDAILTY